MSIRVISAIVMAIITIPLLIVGNVYFNIFVTILAIFSLYELQKRLNIPIIIKIISIVLTICFLLINKFNSNYMIIFYLLVFLIPIVIINDNNKYNINSASYVIFSTLFINYSFFSIIFIREKGINILLYLVIISIANDMFAFFIGKIFGKHKLCPNISPNKTIEGFFSGIVISTILGSMFYIFFINSNNIYIVIMITFILSNIGTLGDLLFSSIKRHFKIKDFSNIIPGHGGILDRLDSLLLIAMSYTLLLGIL